MMPGPVPKRSSERRRRNKGGDAGIEPEQIKVDLPEVEAPAPYPWWEATTTEFYLGHVGSVQTQFYEPSDYQLLLMVCEQLDRENKPKPIVTGEGEDQTVTMMRVPMPGSKMTAILKALAELMATEGTRRRLRLEIERNNAAAELDPNNMPANVVALRQDLLG